MPEVSVIIISYHAKTFLSGCLRSLSDHIDTSYEIIIVENNSGEDLEFLKDEFPEVRIVYHDTNVGFGGGNNVGVHHARGEYLFFLNPDTTMQNGQFSDVISKMRETEHTGAVGLTLMNENGHLQAHQYGQTLTLPRLFKQNFTSPQAPSEPVEYTVWKQVDWTSGGAFVCSRTVFEEVGGFDEDFFLYMEDIDLGKRLTETGHQNYWTNLLRVFHEEGGTETLRLTTKQRYYSSQRRYFRKHFGVWTTPLLLPVHWLLLLKLRFSK
jgi:GT2 family glycosyltransferase